MHLRICWLVVSMTALPPSAMAQSACIEDGAAPVSSDPEARYRAARVHYEAARYADAAAGFRSVAFGEEGSLAPYAAQLYLDALNRLYAAGNAGCGQAIADAIDPLMARHCGGADEAALELCDVLTRLRCAVTRRRAEALGAAQRHREAERVLRTLLREPPRCPRSDELLFNAAGHAEAAGSIDRAVDLRDALLRQHPDSALAPRALFAQALAHQAIASYAEAATAYERFAERYPGEAGTECAAERDAAGRCPAAPEALARAFAFRIGLGDVDAARRDAELFERNYLRTSSDRAAELALALAFALEDAGQWRQLVRTSERLLRVHGGRAPDIAIHAHRLAARALRELGRGAAQRRHLEAVVGAWRAGAPSRLPVDPPPAPRAHRPLARDAFAEALFHLSDAAADSVLDARPSTPRRATRGWVNRVLAPWMERQRAAIDALGALLEPVAQLDVPEWTIAALERLASAEAHVARAIATVAETLPEAERAASRVPSARWRRAALDHYRGCAAWAIAARWPSEIAMRCNEALTRLDPTRHPAGPDELLGPWQIPPGAASPRPALDPEAAEAAASTAPRGVRAPSR